MFVLFVAAMAVLGGLLFGYDTGVISGAILVIRHDFDLSTSLQAIVVSIVLIGAMLGALLAGGVADRFGRRPTLLIAGAVFVYAALCIATIAFTAWIVPETKGRELETISNSRAAGPTKALVVP